MRVLFLHQFDLDFAGGSGVYLRAVTDQLRRSGHDVDVVSARRSDQYGCTRYELPFDVTLTFGPEKRPGETALDELSAEDLRALIERATGSIARDVSRDHRPDLIIANHINLMAGVGQQLSDRFEVPFRIISYGTDTELLLRDTRYVDLFIGPAAAAERIFAISGYVARQIVSVLNVRHVAVLGGAVDRQMFHPPPDDVDGHPRMSFVGRLVTEKGLWTLLEAVDRQSVLAELDIIGEGPLSPRIANHVRQNGLDARVRLHGYVPPRQIRELLLQSALLVVPSTWQEPLGLVVLEAMACGIPVVASAVGGIPEIIRHGFNGYLVDPGDAGQLARTLDTLMGDQGLRRQLRDNCRNRTPIASYGDLAQRLVQ